MTTSTTTATTTIHDRPRSSAGQPAAGRLRVVLRANAATSAVTGLIGVIAPQWVADTIGIDQVGLVRLVGLGLVGFAAMVLWASTLTIPRLRTEALVISMGDLGWVGVTVIVLLTGGLNATGTVLAVLIAAVVAGFGLAQLWFRRRLG